MIENTTALETALDTNETSSSDLLMTPSNLKGNVKLQGTMLRVASD